MAISEILAGNLPAGSQGQEGGKQVADLMAYFLTAFLQLNHLAFITGFVIYIW